MPELPDITIYVEALSSRVVGRVIERIHAVSPFLIRSVDPPIETAEGHEVLGVHRLGKRIVLTLTDELFLVFHLMVAGRFRWAKRRASPPGKIGLAAFEFPGGTLLLTEASRKNAPRCT